jgi:ABC-type lipoprotein export system ATPase subunit
MNSPCGSIWRKWDLHVHTPGTKLNDRYGGETPENWQKFIDQLEQSEVRAFGITDYYSIDGFEYLYQKQKDGMTLKNKAIFPNIEFRLPQSSNKEGDEINIHLLFDNSASVVVRIKKFLADLKTINTKRDGTRYCCNSDDFQELGYDKACVEISSIKESLGNIFGKEKPYLIVGVANGYGGIRPDAKSPRKIGIAEEIDKECDLFFARSQDRDFFLRLDRYDDAKGKPVISGSDVHSFDQLERWLGKEFVGEDGTEREITWIKADLTFEGLKQIIYEPISRVYIGEMPEKMEMVHQSPQYFISNLKISSTKNDSEWFDNSGEVLLNPELVSIIGNKGSGKSALADLIAMGSNSCNENYSFLYTNKFLALPAHKKYSAKVSFLDGQSLEKGLSDPEFDASKESKAVYLSQDFVKRMCESESIDDLQAEIDRVIFDRMPFDERHGTESLTEVINNLCDGIDSQILKERTSLASTIKKIIQYGKYIDPSFRENNKRLLHGKEKEYELLEKNGKPKLVNPPSKVRNETIVKEIEELRIQIRDVQASIDKVQNKILEFNSDKLELQRLHQIIEGFRRQTDSFVTEITTNSVALKYGLTIKNLGILSPEIKPIVDVIAVVNKQIEDNAKIKTESIKKKNELEAKMKQLHNSLSAQEKAFEEYKTKFEKWETKKKELIGDAKTPGTVSHYKRWIEFIDKEATKTLSKYLEELKETSNQIASLILKKKSQLDGIYFGIRAHTKSILEATEIAEEEFVDVSSGITVSLRFEKEFLSMINQKRRGTFSGVNSGAKELRKILSTISGDDENSIIQLPDLIITALEYDQTIPSSSRTKQSIDDQLVEGISKEQLYNLIYGLDYLETRAAITYAGKQLKHLSPGEKGTVMLIFFLLIDIDRRPIIIDQPEENLDNETVFKILVPLVKKVKSQRQIIIVTHNPNLAVVTDAEQIIRSMIDKEHGNQIKYISGSIESFNIRQSVINVLEGTEKAFKNRRNKYELNN